MTSKFLFADGAPHPVEPAALDPFFSCTPGDPRAFRENPPKEPTMYAVKISLYDITRDRVTATFTPFRVAHVQRASDYARTINETKREDLPPLVRDTVNALVAVVPGTRYQITASVEEEL